MKREIKFRAWYETAKRYSKPFGLESSVLNYTDDDGIGVIKSISTEIIEQFTGIKDKNGVEIYEGDIVEIIILSNSKIISKTKEIVIFQDSCFGFIFGNRREFHTFRDFCNTTLEVIGNIHQDPELIKNEYIKNECLIVESKMNYETV